MSAYGAAIRVWHMAFDGLQQPRRTIKLRWRPEKISAGVWSTIRTCSKP
jgi:hypothetical protein